MGQRVVKVLGEVPCDSVPIDSVRYYCGVRANRPFGPVRYIHTTAWQKFIIERFKLKIFDNYWFARAYFLKLQKDKLENELD